MTRPPRSIQKILAPNDLGHTGSHQSGIHIPKAVGASGFFPILSRSQYNPEVQITVFTPENEEHWALRFIHYNNKLHGLGTRDEFRLTGTKRMLEALGASPGDVLLITHTFFGDLEARLVTTVREEATFPRVTILSGGWSLTIADS